MFELKTRPKEGSALARFKLGRKVFVSTQETSLKSGTEVSELCLVGMDGK